MTAFGDLGRRMRQPDPTRQTAALRHVGEAWARAAQHEAPRGETIAIIDGAVTHIPGGALQDSIRFEMTGPDSGALVMARHGIYVQKGTPPHRIMPRNKKALRFFSGRAGAMAIRRAVNHPGTRANPFLDRAWRSSEVQAALRAYPLISFRKGLL